MEFKREVIDIFTDFTELSHKEHRGYVTSDGTDANGEMDYDDLWVRQRK